jgi:hypothetical protein
MDSDTDEPTFVDLWLRWSEGTEPPTIYHKWSAIFTISSLVSRRCYLYGGEIHPYYCTLFMLFIGDPALGKGRATGRASLVIDQVDPRINSPDSVSGSKLFLEMSERKREFTVGTETRYYSPMAYISEELESFTKADDELMSSLVDLWAKSKYTYLTHAHKDITIYDPALTFLGNTNLTTFSTFVRSGRIAQGLARRLLLIYANEPACVRALSEDWRKNPTKVALYERIIWGAKFLAEAKGEFGYTDEWAALFEADHQRNHKRAKEKEFSHSAIDIYFKARKELVARLSMIACLSRIAGLVKSQDSLDLALGQLQGRCLILCAEDFHQADQWLKQVESNLDEVYMMASPNSQVPLRIQLADRIREAPHSKDMLLEWLYNHTTIREAKEILASMEGNLFTYENGKAKLIYG